MSTELGRNEPCHCGSGKKFKRCHGVDAAPKLSTPKLPEGAAAAGAPGGMPAGFDPSKMDPAMMRQFAQAMGRMPKGQLQRLQSVMQRAMAGKDVAAEARELEGAMSPELQTLMIQLAGQMQGAMGEMPGAPGLGAGLGMPGLPGPDSGAAIEGGMSEEEARRIVAAAAEQGKISSGEADQLLAAPEKKGIGKLWRNITGK